MSDFDIRDLVLEAMADLQETMREVQIELVKPQMTEKLSQMWMSLPDEMKKKFREEQPQEYADLMGLMK